MFLCLSGEITTYQYDPVGRLSKVYYPFSGGKKEINRIERSNYFGLKANLGNQKEYYRQKHNPDQYISEMTYQLRNEVEDLHKKIRENGGQIDFYNNGYYIEEYKYDPAGNVVQEANAWGTIDFKYNSANQLLEAGDRSYSYDKNGNLIKDGHKNNYAEYSYNYENRLIKASNLSKDNKLLGGEHPFKGTIDYSYDALGRKLSKLLKPNHGNRVEVSGYYYDGRASNVLAEYENLIWNMKQYHKGKKNGNGNIQGGQIKHFNEYYYGNGLIAFNSMNNPNPWNIRPDVNFYHKDALGSITAITGKNGNVVEEYKYGAYGNPYKGRFLNMQKNNPYGFTGQRYEAEIRMYSFAFRTYNPVSTRWMTQDPVRDGTNWYQYVNGDPVNLWDPLGLCKDESGKEKYIDVGYGGVVGSADDQLVGEVLDFEVAGKRPTSLTSGGSLSAHFNAADIIYKTDNSSVSIKAMSAEGTISASVGENTATFGGSVAIMKVEVVNEYELFGYNVKTTAVGDVGALAAKAGVSVEPNKFTIEGEWATGLGAGAKVEISKNKYDICPTFIPTM